ncbi:heme peroxidase [Phlegmacium glaucopus]|nr:heme peroxidase [Phlegmacium glaucopus]
MNSAPSVLLFATPLLALYVGLLPHAKLGPGLYVGIGAAATGLGLAYYYYNTVSDGSYGLAWYASGTYDKDSNTGGSNYATMRFEPESLHGANAGLNIARELMEKVKEEFPWISYGDLWTLAGVAAIQEMAGPKIPWRPGRIDGFAAQATPDGRLPDAKQGGTTLGASFTAWGTKRQALILNIHPVSTTKKLSLSLWVWKKWNGPKQLEDKKTKSLMMLTTDYVLVQDKSFKKFSNAYVESQELWFKDTVIPLTQFLQRRFPSIRTRCAHNNL